MLEDISKSRLKTVHPALARKIEQMDDYLSPRYSIRVVQARRSWAEQAAVFAQGRTALGPACVHHGVARKLGTCATHPMGLRVSNAPPGYGYHEFGLAVDLCPDDPAKLGYQPDWDASHESYREMECIGLTLGLTEGARWRSFPDHPHYQLTGLLPVNPDDRVRQLFQDGGIEAVWAATGLVPGVF